MTWVILACVNGYGGRYCLSLGLFLPVTMGMEVGTVRDLAYFCLCQWVWR